MRGKKSSVLTWSFLIYMIFLLISCRAVEKDSSEILNPVFRPVTLYYENSNGEEGITTYYYDIKGQNYLAHWQLADSSRSSINYYQYDSLGNQIRKFREFSDGLTSEQHYYYDTAGLLARQEFSKSDGVKGNTVYEYNEQGKCVGARCEGLNGWFFGDLVFSYDGEGTKTGAIIYREQDSIGFVGYSYDYFGNLVGEFWDLNGQWTQTFTYEYQQEAMQTFTSSNVFIRENRWFRVEEEKYTYNDETGGPSYYEYDDDGRLVMKEYIRSDGLTTKTNYTYDSTGILRSSFREYHDGITAEFHYWYSIDRKLLVKTFERSDGGRGSETYHYGDSNLLINGELDNFDDWLNGGLEFDYDETGLLKSGKFTGLDGFDADLQFEYDKNHNLVTINWDFSFGGFQKYYFLYESL